MELLTNTQDNRVEGVEYTFVPMRVRPLIDNGRFMHNSVNESGRRGLSLPR
jgi:hypothetical protein